LRRVQKLQHKISCCPNSAKFVKKKFPSILF
jgi:hypothetical protein